MSSVASGLKLTPKTRLYPSHIASRAIPDDEKFQFTLHTIIGTTTNSPNGFDYDSERHLFAYCAGPAAVLSDVDADLTVKQRLFRAKPNAVPINSTPSFYNNGTLPNTPTRMRQTSPLKDGLHSNSHAGYLDSPMDSPGNIKLQSRSREASCLSLSRFGELLAVGETGYNPRVLLFSIAAGAPADVPLSQICDHSFGIKSIAFSPDSKWLCSLGNAQDGFLLLYSINIRNGTAKLHSSNKCSNVNGIVWMSNVIVSYGNRHVRLWKTEGSFSPKKPRSAIDNNAQSLGNTGPKILSGQNSILGDLLDDNFHSAVAVSDYEIVLGTSRGNLCILDETSRLSKLQSLVQVQFAVHSLYFDREAGIIWAAGHSGRMQSFRLLDLKDRCVPQVNPEPSLTEAADFMTIAVGKIRGLLLTVSDRQVEIVAPETQDASSAIQAPLKTFPAHESSVLGVCPLEGWGNPDQPSFLTYSSRGSVLLWRFDGQCVGRIEIPLDQLSEQIGAETNELKALTIFENQETLLAGDKLGVLRWINRSGAILQTLHAHQGDINSIATSNGNSGELACTCGRDRTLQLFRVQDTKLELIQTLDDHASSVTDVKFLDNATSLLSISSDRTVLIRKAALGEEAFAFLPVRVITLKASPVSFAVPKFDPSVLVVSTMDRQVQKFEINTGRLLRSFRPSDPLSNDSVLLNSLQISAIDTPDGEANIILATSTTDRSIRIHDFETGMLLGREYGQASVSAVAILREGSGLDSCPKILSCGHDGTVIAYNLIANTTQRFDSPCESPVRVQTPISAPPLRKTLTKSELAEFQKALEETTGDTVTPTRSTSPSRMKRKTSRYSLAPRATIPIPPAAANTTAPAPKRRVSQDQSPRNASPPNTLKGGKIKARPTLDHRRRSKSAANLNDLNVSALCDALRTFRGRLNSSAASKLEPDIRKELRTELQMTSQAMSEMDDSVAEVPRLPPKPDSENFDAYLAKMIDERLALQSKEKENRVPESRKSSTTSSFDQAGARSKQS